MAGKKFGELNAATEAKSDDLYAIRQDRGGGVHETRKLTGEMIFQWIRQRLDLRYLGKDDTATNAAALQGHTPQSAPYDATAGRLLQVGAFGLGAGDQNLTDNISCLDPTLRSGFYSGTGWRDTPLGNLGSSQWGYLLVEPLASDAQNYRKVTFTENSQRGNIWVRICHSGTWGPWLCQTPLGEGQDWTDVTSIRSKNTPYHNNTGRTIEVSVVQLKANGSQAYISVDGMMIANNDTTHANPRHASAVATVSDGSTYVVGWHGETKEGVSVREMRR